MPKWQHIKRGTVYREIARGKLQTDVPLQDYADLVAYVGEDGQVWFRPVAELEDRKRFERYPEPKVAEDVSLVDALTLSPAGPWFTEAWSDLTICVVTDSGEEIARIGMCDEPAYTATLIARAPDMAKEILALRARVKELEGR